MGSYWMRTARRGQLEKAVHFAVLVANSLYWLRAGYTGASPVPPSLAISFLQIGFPRNMWSGRQGLYLEDDGKEPLACSTPIEQQLAGQLFELSDQSQSGTKRVPG
ncbi:unnamed protein product [Sphagnum tenellum]